MTYDLSHTTAVILAAGRGKRMNAKRKNKVAFTLAGQPVIARTLASLQSAGISSIIAVVGFQADSVRAALGNSVTYAVQKEQLGTGHALQTAMTFLPPNTDTVLSVYGDDSAFYPPQLYRDIVQKLRVSQADLIVLTLHKDDPTGLGRIVRDQAGQIMRIVEDKNATPEEKLIQEINTGFYCFKRSFLADHLTELKKNALTGEYYATDLVEIALKHGLSVDALYMTDSSIWYGVNNREDLSQARKKIHG